MYQSPSKVVYFCTLFNSTLVVPVETITPALPFPPEYFLFAGVDQSGGLVDKSG